jgi:HD-GYP domain-containing protein (c-di-GMP phosphodiesterase class II)
MTRIGVGEINIGSKLSWTVYDSNGILLLKKGTIVQTQRQLEILLSRGVYRDSRETHAATAPATRLPDELNFNISPFVHLSHLSGSLGEQFDALTKGKNLSPNSIMDLGRNIQRLCGRDSDALLGAIHLYHDLQYTASHPIHSAILCEIFADSLGYDQRRRLTLLCAALTSNISIVELQTLLHNQTGPMNSEQLLEMEYHPLRSVDMLRAAGVTDEIWLNAVAQHHERNDGSGYSQGITDAIICEEAKIIALADIYTAMVVAKSYRGANPANEILRALFLTKGKQHDEVLCLQLIKLLGVFPPGSFVTLANGETAVITRRAQRGKMWPKSAAILNPQGNPYLTPQPRDCNENVYKITGMCAINTSIQLNLNVLWEYA